MNGWLLVLRHGMDDVPVGLFHDERGSEIATRVWNWIQSEKNIDLVPWVKDPTSDKYDKEKVVAHTARIETICTLEQLIQEWSKELGK